jgi:cation transport regulator ChaB
MPVNRDDIPSTLARSAQKVQDAYEKTLESAEETYDGDEERAHRAAWGSVKHIAEKKGDHWELKDEQGSSDTPGDTAGGIDKSKTKDELLDDAREADIPGRSKMTKDQLVDALQKHSERETARARG